MRRMKTFLWAVLIAGAWLAWFIAEAFLVDWMAGPVLDTRELRPLVPQLLASMLAGVLPALALRGRLRSIGVQVPRRLIAALMVLTAPLGAAIHLVLPRASWFWSSAPSTSSGQERGDGRRRTASRDCRT